MSVSLNALLANLDGRITVPGATAPTSGTWNVGDKVYKTNPVVGGNIGWVCVTAGTPGTWKEFGVIEA